MTKLSSGGQIVVSTYLGGSGYDAGVGIAVDATGVYVAGTTTSRNFPLYFKPDSSFDVFVTKLFLNMDGLAFTSIVGGGKDDLATGLAVNPATHNIYVCGYTNSPDFPNIYPSDSGFHQPSLNGGNDAFACRLASNGRSIAPICSARAATILPPRSRSI